MADRYALTFLSHIGIRQYRVVEVGIEAVGRLATQVMHCYLIGEAGEVECISSTKINTGTLEWTMRRLAVSCFDQYPRPDQPDEETVVLTRITPRLDWTAGSPAGTSQFKPLVPPTSPDHLAELVEDYGTNLVAG